jgi:quercetin dioxygenase-like cupin family protein
MTAAVKVPYRVNLDDVPQMHVTPPSQEAPSTISVKMVYGSDTGLMIARREKGYHSRPHRHDSEQWNYVLDGEIWFFIDKDGFRCVKGDIVRVPRNLVHWTWVRSPAGCVMVESHTPSLTGDPDLAVRALAMPIPGESVDPSKGVNNIWVDYPQSIEIERRAIAADPD